MFKPLFKAPFLLLAALYSTARAADASDINAVNLRSHSLAAPYLDSDVQARWWDFGGSTVVRADQYIRLTSQQPSQRGWLFSRLPLTATNWEVEIELKIHGSGSLWGDGMAIWFTKDRAEPGPVFGNKDRFEGLGIFIDTYKNDRPGVVFPYIMAMSGDGNTPYDKDNDGKASELAGCSVRGIRNADYPTKLKITYFQDAMLSMHVIYKKENEWTRCFEVPNVKLPTIAYMGFTAETGELSDNHDIISVDAKQLYSPTGQVGSPSGPAGSKQYSKDKYSTGKKSGSSWWWILLQLLLVALVVAAAYVGFTVYRTQQRRDRF